MSYLQIASWNIEHLGGHNRAERRQSAYALAEHIEMSGIHVIALQEIYVTPDEEVVKLAPSQFVVPRATSGTRRNSDLDTVCYLLEEHLDVAWRYEILENRNRGDKSQLCAVMWNTARVTLDKITPLPVSHRDGDHNLWDRKPHLLSFSSDQMVWRKDEAGNWHEVGEKRSFSLIPLHMKSNMGGATVNRIVRAKEALTLCEALKGMEGAYDPSLIMIGDTNILKYDEPAIETFINFGLTDLNNNDSATYWSVSHKGAPFDRAFISKNRKEYKYSRQYVLWSSDLQAHDRLLSDHYMIKIAVKDYVDDADPREA